MQSKLSKNTVYNIDILNKVVKPSHGLTIVGFFNVVKV